MKNQQNQSIRAYALQVVLSLALLFGFAILFASLNAAAPAAADRAQPTVVAQPGFYPPLPFAPEGVPSCTPIEITDSMGTGLPKQMGRITPPGPQSACGAPNSCSITPGMFQYKSYTFTNTTGAERCVTATLQTPCGAGGGEEHALFVGAYLGSFDPANPCTNLIGDTGIVSSGFNIPFGFNVPAGATFVIVVSETVEDQGCFAYKVHLEGLCGGQPTPTATATATSTPTATATATPKTTPTPTPSPTPTPTPPKISQLTPTNVTCDEFLSGTAPSLDFLEYSLKGTPPKINQVDPGAFFYWVKVNAQAGSNTVMVNETITSGNFNTFFTYLAGSNVFNSDCVSQHAAVSQVGGTVSLTFNAPSAGLYVVLVKFQSQSLKGANAPSPGTTVHYVFDATGVVGSALGIDLRLKPNSQ